ncbi:MAG: hypothetical protein ACYC27_02935 [Armatimonadota bacterium]
MKILIVSKHKAEVKFIKHQAMLPDNTEVIENPTPEDVTGNIVFGNLPFELAALTQLVLMVVYKNSPPSEQGIDYVEDFIDAGAHLQAYKVTTI